ncbi:MAG: YtzI protein [Lysinibacillus sp.]
MMTIPLEALLMIGLGTVVVVLIFTLISVKYAYRFKHTIDTISDESTTNDNK